MCVSVCASMFVCIGGLGEQAVKPYPTAPSHMFLRPAREPLFPQKAFDSVPCVPQGDIKDNGNVLPSVYPVHSDSGFHPQFITTTPMRRRRRRRRKQKRK